MSLDNGFAANGAAAGANVVEGNEASFQNDVIEASKQVPVLVDFWAPWCGPCRTLGPTIERVVAEQKGKVKLVKINVDENQGIAGQLRIQSIPTVYAFSGGQPVDGFMGALPESEIRKFIDKILASAPAGGGAESELEQVLNAAKEAIEAGDLNSAAQLYGAVLQQAPDNADALIGLAGIYEKSGQIDEAKAVLQSLPAEALARDDYKALQKSIALAEEAAELGSVADLEQRLAANPDDHQARFDLAVALNAKGQRVEAAEALVALMRRDREWNEDGARKRLLEFFDAWGPKDPATLKGRRLLSAVLFS